MIRWLGSSSGGRGRRKGSLNRPVTNVDPASKRGFRYANAFRPFGDGHRVTVERQVSNVSGVVVLLSAGCPSAVAGFVSSIVVDPIQRMVRGRGIAHVLVKGSERVEPPFADSDSPPAIVRVLRVVLSRAPGLHGFPGNVFLSAAHPVLGVVSKRVRIACEAAAAFRCPVPQIGSENDAVLLAIAPAQPLNGAVRPGGDVAGFFDHHEATEPPSRKINTSGHDTTLLCGVSLEGGWGAAQRKPLVASVISAGQAPSDCRRIIPVEEAA